MRLVPIALSLLACRSHAPKRPLPDRAPYLVLFEGGRSFSLPIEAVTGHMRDAHWELDPTRVRGTLTCTVAAVRAVGDADVSTVTCAAPHAALLLSGTWAATPAGLYHPYLPIDDPDDLTLLGEDDLLLTTVPREREHSHVVDGTEDSIEAFTFDSSWCIRHTTESAALQRSYSLCFGSTGVTGGGEVVIADGKLERMTFGESPPAPEDPTADDED